MSTILATSLKGGVTFLLDGKPYRVYKYAHQKIGRGGANVRVTIRNLITGNQEEKNFPGNAKFDGITTIKRPLQYLYHDGATIAFMDPDTFEQIEIPVEVIGDDIDFLKEGDTADVLFWDDKPLSIDLPPKITLEVAETAPGVKGNSASNMLKPARLENGVTIKVPLFIKKGDKIRVDTRNREYVERTN